MDRPTLQADKRQDVGTRAARRLRREGHMPAVLYGHQRQTVHLTLDRSAVEQALQAGARVVDLDLGDSVETALLKEVQYDPMGDDLLHLDLARIDAHERVTVTVPVRLRGVPKGVEEEDGVLDHVLQDLEIECPALSIPDHLRVEVAHLAIGDAVHVRELEVPEGVTLLQEPDAVVATVHPPMMEPEAEEAEAAEAALPTEPELIGAEREEKEDESEPEG